MWSKGKGGEKKEMQNGAVSSFLRLEQTRTSFFVALVVPSTQFVLSNSKTPLSKLKLAFIGKVA